MHNFFVSFICCCKFVTPCWRLLYLKPKIIKKENILLFKFIICGNEKKVEYNNNNVGLIYNFLLFVKSLGLQFFPKAEKYYLYKC